MGAYISLCDFDSSWGLYPLLVRVLGPTRGITFEDHEDPNRIDYIAHAQGILTELEVALLILDAFLDV